MESVIKNLLFDKELVNQIREGKVEGGLLYQSLISGKITLEEFLAATRNQS
jgi:hypothetical protein